MFTFVVVLLTTTSAFGSDFSCNFSKDECGWFLGGGQNCRWEIKKEHSRIKKGYLILVGAPGCSAPLAWSFGANHKTNANDMTLEYFMTGAGPVSLSVANDEDGLNWSCTLLKPGNQKRMARARINSKAKYIYIKASVGPGSELVITQIWNSHLGEQAETVCPQIFSGNNTTTTLKSTESFSPTESRANVTSKIPETFMNTTKSSYNVTTSTGGHSTTQAPRFDHTNAWYKQLWMIFEKLISTKSHSISVTGNITMRINLNIAAKNGQ